MLSWRKRGLLSSSGHSLKVFTLIELLGSDLYYRDIDGDTDAGGEQGPRFHTRDTIVLTSCTSLIC